MIIELLQENNVKFKRLLHERLKQIIDIQLAEMRYDIIQKEFGFLNERISVGDNTNPTKNYNQKTTLTKQFVKQKLNKDPTNQIATKTNTPTGYKKINGQLIRMSSVEKFNRRTAISKRKFKTDNHIKVAVRKRGQVIQKNKVLGITKDKTLGTQTHG